MARCPNPISGGKTILILLLSMVMLGGHASAQQASASQQADTLFAEAKWEQAAQAYASITTQDPANGPAWQHLGECDLQLQRFDDSIKAFQHAVDLKYRPLMTKVDIARAYVAKDETRHALDTLKELTASGL